MKKTALNIICRAGMPVDLESLTSPCVLGVGEVNLFLVRGDDSVSGSHTFITTLQEGDSLFFVSHFGVDGETYRVIAVPVVDMELICEDGLDEALWREKIAGAVSLLAEEHLAIVSVPELLIHLVAVIKTLRQKRQELILENRELTDVALRSKVAALGAIAGVSLEETEKNGDGDSDALFLALQELACCYHLSFDKGLEFLRDREMDMLTRLKNFTAAAQWRIRKVTLPPNFYKQSSQPILAFRKETGEPLVLFLSANGSHYIGGGRDRSRKVLSAKVADGIEESAFCFYELFPAGKLTRGKLLNFIFANAKPILGLIIAVGLISAILGLVAPVATAYITGKIIPSANLPELWQLMILLIVLAICEIGLGVVPSLVMMLFSARQFERFQAAVFDHILKIPVKAYQLCDAGDMTSRVLGGTQIQSTVFGILSRQFTGSLFSLVSLAMMFYYSPSLATVGVVMVLIYSGVFLLLARINLRPLALHAASAGRLSGLMKQFFDGIAKIRSAGAEQRIVSRFMDDFSTMTRAEYVIGKNGAYQSIFASVFPMMISVVFFAMAGGMQSKNLSFPVFLAFMAAFQNFQGGLMGVTEGIWSLLAIRPEVDRIMPILETESEDAGEKHSPGKLDGDIELSHVNFRYAPDLPLILQDVSIHAKPGEFIAVVGPSGAGKSTLVRLLLGFEKPEGGGIYYTGKDMENLDRRAIRRQLGVILQNSMIMNGSILENITTGTDYTAEDAHKALKLAAMEQDVDFMPMGIHTPVSPGTVSGGQQQRILIARALVGNPVAVIMDESTSALDNAAQETIKKNMEQLRMTRIVIAHRLSTIVNADRIYVMDKGRVVQCGTYSELLCVDGVFKQLVERQLTERI